MIYPLYNLLLTLLLVFASPYLLLRCLFQEGFRKKWAERLALFDTLPAKEPIWVHAASVGEVFCCLPLLKRIKKDFPQAEIVMTTMTRTGREAAKAQAPEASAVFFFPVDHPLIIRRMLAKIRPRLLLIAETELWPNLLRSCGEKKIPVVLFNGRISQKSFPRYLRLKFFFKKCLKPVHAFLMQTEGDRDRIVAIGAPPEKTKVAGNVKFDQAAPNVTEETISRMAQSFGLGDEKILIAGSTHAGEEEILLNTLHELRMIHPRLILFLAPRHLDRLAEVEKVLKKASVPWQKRTSFSGDPGAGDRPATEPPWVILLDTMGELMSLYSLGTIIFVGGSLVPIGGHNPLEPLFFKKPVLFGPHMFNFSEVSRGLTEAGGAIQTTGGEDLLVHLKRLFSDGKARVEMGEKGYQFLQKHRGATEWVFETIRPFLFDKKD
jgi:3-deoxy-D-manno-octulosonic-acid transferase